jgi:hypothetical protein
MNESKRQWIGLSNLEFDIRVVDDLFSHALARFGRRSAYWTFGGVVPLGFHTIAVIGSTFRALERKSHSNMITLIGIVVRMLIGKKIVACFGPRIRVPENHRDNEISIWILLKHVLF